MKDPFFGQASVDIDELRDQPVPTGTCTAHSRDRYPVLDLLPARRPLRGPFPTHDRRWRRGIRRHLRRRNGRERDEPQFSNECGAYMVESNQGHIGLDLSVDRPS